MTIPLNFLLWAFAAALCLHVVEESTVGGGFVAEVRRTFWPDYSSRHFFWFNTAVFLAYVGGVVAYEIAGGAWAVVPLSWVFMFVTNGLWHLLQTIATGRYAPGLITSPIYWILLSFVLRYGWQASHVSTGVMVSAAISGTLLTLGMFVGLRTFGSASRRRHSAGAEPAL